MIREKSIWYRGAINPTVISPQIMKGDYSFLRKEKMGFYFCYQQTQLGFYAVDRFASFPLFYIMVKGKPVVSEVIDELLPFLHENKFDPIGYFGTGMNFTGERNERTPFLGINRIPPGHYLEYKNGKTQLNCYWSFSYFKDKRFTGTYEEATEELGFLIKQAIKRCYNFAPNAALHLSGGIDSGSIAAFMCQFSNEERLAYSLQKPDAPLKENPFESGFIGKYTKQYTHLKLEYLNPLDHFVDNPILIEGAGNWHAIHMKHEDVVISNHAKLHGKKYILTGLGGDELASFGNNYQHFPYSIKNDREANWYMNWFFGRKKRWIFYIKGLLGKDGPILDSYRSTRLGKIVDNRSYWYSKPFITSINSMINLPTLIPDVYPANYEYRLDILRRSYFTYRSDNWNYLGLAHNVNYLHPLLDGDLVDFCASLPRLFYKTQKYRQLIKRGLSKHLPSELLEGNKRPVYSKQSFQPEKLSLKIKSVNSRIRSLKNTFANTVYDYEKLERLMVNFEKIIKTIPSSHQQTYFMIDLFAEFIGTLSLRGEYLNKYFS